MTIYKIKIYDFPRMRLTCVCKHNLKLSTYLSPTVQISSHRMVMVMHFLTIMLLVANFANTKSHKKAKIWPKPWHMGAHMRALSESYPMNINMTAFRRFLKIFVTLCFGKSSLSIGRVNANHSDKFPYYLSYLGLFLFKGELLQNPGA